MQNITHIITPCGDVLGITWVRDISVPHDKKVVMRYYIDTTLYEWKSDPLPTREEAIAYRDKLIATLTEAGLLHFQPVKFATAPWSFDWSKVPEGYDYAAMDPNGDWWRLSDAPVINTSMECWQMSKLPRLYSKKFDHPPFPGDWRDSLQTRPATGTTDTKKS